MNDSPRAIWWGAALLVIAGVACYVRSIDAPFIFDDIPAIVENDSIRDLSRMDRVLQPPGIGSNVTSRPLVNLSFAINYAIGGLNPRGYHVVNVILHLLGALALFGVLRRILGLPTVAERLQAHALPAAFAVALLWTVHPLQSETVICAAQRTESLVSLFYLLTLYCFVRAATGEHPRRWFTRAITACAAGMASKEVMATAPIALFLFDRAFVGGTFGKTWRRRWRWHLGIAGTWVLLAYLVFYASGGQRGRAAGFGLGVSAWDYLLTQAHAIAVYLKLTIWPHPLIVDYGIWLADGIRSVVWELALVLTLFAATVVGLKRWPRASFGGVWFFVVLAPSSSVVPLVTQTIAEHRMYLPLAGLLATAVVGGYWMLQRRTLVLALGLAAAAAFATIQRTVDYADEITLWSDMAAHAPENGWAPLYLGNALLKQKRFAEAESAYRAAVKLMPRHPDAHNGLGAALVEQQRPGEALESLSAALELKPDYAQAHYWFGRALLALGHPEKAVPSLTEAVRLSPGLAMAHYHLALAQVAAGNLEVALPSFIAATRLDPHQADYHLNLGGLYLRLNRAADALAPLERAVELMPDSADAHAHLGDALALLGRLAEVIPHYEAAERLQPDSPVSSFNLASALLQLDRRTDAREHFAEALRRDPAFTPAERMLRQLDDAP